MRPGMTPDETSPVPVDEHLLAQMMACDASLHAGTPPDGGSATLPSTTDADDRARGRLLLLLRLLDAAEAPSGAER